jgi:sporulation protein YlmC with PRC-barrel domain
MAWSIDTRKLERAFILAITESSAMAQMQPTMQPTPAPTYDEAQFRSERNVITTDGRRIGHMTGILVDASTWKVQAIVVKLEKAILDELNIKKPIFSTPSVSIPVDLVSNTSDVVQLNGEFSSLIGILAPIM